MFLLLRIQNRKSYSISSLFECPIIVIVRLANSWSNEANSGQMLFALFALLAADDTKCREKPNCLSCLDTADCFFCRSSDEKINGCYPLSANETVCQGGEVEKERTKKCVEELGGDAKDSVRYAIGGTILAVAIIIDITIRIFSRRSSQDEYSHL